MLDIKNCAPVDPLQPSGQKSDTLKDKIKKAPQRKMHQYVNSLPASDCCGAQQAEAFCAAFCILAVNVTYAAYIKPKCSGVNTKCSCCETISR